MTCNESTMACILLRFHPNIPCVKYILMNTFLISIWSGKHLGVAGVGSWRFIFIPRLFLIPIPKILPIWTVFLDTPFS